MNPNDMLESNEFGRPILKPEGPKDMKVEMEKFYDYYDDANHVEARIEHMKMKIALKQSFDNALNQDKGETKTAGILNMKKLAKEGLRLRNLLVQALQSEKMAVQSAMDSHKEFQMALGGKKAFELVPWLEDKVYTVEKQLNLVISELLTERRKVVDIKQVLSAIDAITEYGGNNSEQVLIQQQNELKFQLSALGIKRETAAALKRCYTKISETLKIENNKFIINLRDLDKKYEDAKLDLQRITIMGDLGKRAFLKMTRTMQILEVDFADFNKERKEHLAYSRAEVTGILESQGLNPKAPAPVSAKTSNAFPQSVFGTELEDRERTEREQEELRKKIKELKEYEEKVHLIVDVMRVPDISFCAPRMESLLLLKGQLTETKEAKVELLEYLKIQNTQLHAVDSYIRYTGLKEELEYDQKKEELNQSIAETTEKMGQVQNRVNNTQAVVQRCREGVRQLLETLGVSAPEVTAVGDLKSQTLLLQTKVLDLAKEVNALRLEMAPYPPIKDLAKYVVPPKCPSRLVRLATPTASDEEEDVQFGLSSGGHGATDNFVAVLKRSDIKKKSARIVKKARLANERSRME